MTVTLSTVQSTYTLEFDAADNISLPTSTPPSYRSRASSCRSYRSGAVGGREPLSAPGRMQPASTDDSRGSDAPPPEYDTWRRTAPCLADEDGIAEHPWDLEDAAVAAASAAAAPDTALTPASCRNSIDSIRGAGADTAAAATDASSPSSSKVVTAEEASSCPTDTSSLSEHPCHVTPPSREQFDSSCTVDIETSSPTLLTTGRSADVS